MSALRSSPRFAKFVRTRRPLLLAAVVIGVALLAIAAVPAAQEGPPPGPAGSFGENSWWDDGKAELSRYAAEELVEGEKRSFTAWSIIVAEHFDPAQMVKKEGFDPGWVPVLKCNWFLNIPTGVSSYQQMASLFLRRSDLLVMKAAFASQEWCGLTFAEWRRDGEKLVTHSYWDGEGDQGYALADLATNTLFYEQLPLWIRGRHPEHVRIEPITLIRKRLGTSKCPAPKLVAAAIWFDGVKDGVNDRGVKDDGSAKHLEARLVIDKEEETFVFACDFPHVLQEWRRADGTTWKLVSTTRLDYWNHNQNEFAHLLK